MENKQYEPSYAIWEKPTKNGGTYLSMKTPDGKWYTFFKNNKKYSDKSPDWYQAKDKDQPPNDGNEYKFNSDIPF